MPRAAPLPARHQLLAYTLLHRFGLSIIDEAGLLALLESEESGEST